MHPDSESLSPDKTDAVRLSSWLLLLPRPKMACVRSARSSLGILGNSLNNSPIPRFILGFGISGLLRIDFQCTGFIPQFFNLIDAVAFGNGFAHRFVPDECGWLRFCWHGVLVPAHASLRCGSSSNRFHTF